MLKLLPVLLICLSGCVAVAQIDPAADCDESGSITVLTPVTGKDTIGGCAADE